MRAASLVAVVLEVGEVCREGLVVGGGARKVGRERARWRRMERTSSMGRRDQRAGFRLDGGREVAGVGRTTACERGDGVGFQLYRET